METYVMIQVSILLFVINQMSRNVAYVFVSMFWRNPWQPLPEP